jgi:hypothetical protein
VIRPAWRPAFRHLWNARRRASSHLSSAPATRDWHEASARFGMSAVSRFPPIVACTRSIGASAERGKAVSSADTPKSGNPATHAEPIRAAAAAAERRSRPVGSETMQASGRVVSVPPAKLRAHRVTFVPCAFATSRTPRVKVAMHFWSAGASSAVAEPGRQARSAVTISQTGRKALSETS